MDRKSERIFDIHKEAVLDETARRFGITADSLNRLGAFESFVFEYAKDKKEYVLKLTHSLHRTPELVRGEIDWTAYLANHDIPVAETIRSIKGETLEIIDGGVIEGLGDDYFLAYAMEKVSGEFVTSKDWTDDQFRQWGRILGRMHAVSKLYEPPDASWRRFEWFQDSTLRIDDHLPNDQEAVKAKCRQLIGRLRSLPTDRESYGLVHSDMHHGNFVVGEKGITVFDFDDCHYNWFAFDISIPLFYVLRAAEVGPDDSAFAKHFLECFLDGYRRENTVESFWLEKIPQFLKLREFDLYMIIHAENAADDNDWCRRFMVNRRERIEDDTPIIDLDFARISI